MACIPKTYVTGIDLNEIELKQAKEVFGDKRNLRFTPDSIEALASDCLTFDIIVFAASIQYFPQFKETISSALGMLSPGGEIHILDSAFYKKSDIRAARERSQLYFASIGFNEMSSFYFHHGIEELEAFKYEIMYNPFAILNKLSFTKTPFYWIRIKI
jgi:ubiquinone/menaquinone biosynthesis C-methylase UbiE